MSGWLTRRMRREGWNFNFDGGQVDFHDVMRADEWGVTPQGVATLAAAGTNQATAAAIDSYVTHVSGADGTKGVKLPAAAEGKMRIIYNEAVGEILKLYPATGDSLVGGSADDAVDVIGGACVICIAKDTADWAVIGQVGGVGIAVDYKSNGSFQPVWVDLTLGDNAGSQDGADPDYLAAMMGNVLGDTLAAAEDANYIAGMLGAFSVTGTIPSTYPVGAVLGQITDGVDSTKVGAFVAYIDGDGSLTRAGAAFKVMHNNSAVGSGFHFGVDLYSAAHDGYDAVDFLTADLRLHNQMTIHNDEADRTMIGARIGVCNDADPASNAPANGVVLYFDGTDLKAKNSAGLTATLNNAAFA